MSVTVMWVRLMVTGHREIVHPELVLERLEKVLVRYGAAEVVAISGGAEGADSLWAQAAVRAGAHLSLYLPNRCYRSFYPNAVSDELMNAADEVRYVIAREEVANWRELWRIERWWRDNFSRNTAMIVDSDIALVVSPRHPRVLAQETKGGTSAAVRELAKRDAKVLWVPDSPEADLTWVQLRSGRAAKADQIALFLSE